MDNRKRLLIVSHVEADEYSTRNRSLNIILNEYSKYFDVSYFGPQMTGKKAAASVNASFYSTTAYGGTIAKRLTFLASSRVCHELDDVVDKVKPNLIQIRVPGLFATKTGLHLKKRHGQRMFCYVAGDVAQATAANFRLLGSRVAGELLALWQDRLLSELPVITAGDALKSALLQRHGGELRCHAYYSTTHNEVYRHSSQRASELLVVGRLEPLKRPFLALDVLKRLHKLGHENYTLRFLGDGPQREPLRLYAQKLGLEDYVVFHGYEHDSRELQEIYLRSEFLLHLSSSEGTSKVLAEAMAHGVVPVAIRNVGSNNYIFIEQPDALFDADSSAIGDSISEMINDREKYTKRQEVGYNYSQEHTLSKEIKSVFDWISCHDE